MKCSEPLSVSELKEIIDEGSWTDSALSMLLDGAVDFLFGLLGHSFGRAIRIYHSEEEDATTVTIQVTSTAIVIVITGGANAGTTTYTFADYSEMQDIVDAIEQADIGVVISLVEGMRPNEKTANLHALAATGMLGLSNRQLLCIQYTTETFDGIGEPMIFTSMPIKSVSSVLQDGVTVTDFWTKSQGYLIYKNAVGGKYNWYSVDSWSVRSPCNIQIRYVPMWLRMPGTIKIVLRALVQNTIVDGAMKSETIGDYSYQIGDVWASIAPWWGVLSAYSINFMP